MPVPHLVRGPPSAKAKTPSVTGRVQCATGVGAQSKRARSCRSPQELKARVSTPHFSRHDGHSGRTQFFSIFLSWFLYLSRMLWSLLRQAP